MENSCKSSITFHMSHNIYTSPLSHFIWLERWLLAETMQQSHSKGHPRFAPAVSFVILKERIWSSEGHNILLVCCTVTFPSYSVLLSSKQRRDLLLCLGIETWTYTASDYTQFICLPLWSIKKCTWTWVTLSSFPSALVEWKSTKINNVSISFKEFLKLSKCCKVISA